jgi:nanoRNase/pAp phosphatase (c-di-AMP/oligoRNAs hydrolase)
MDPQQRLDALLAAVAGTPRLLILPHNDPDPDAIASALALRYLLQERAGVDSLVAYSGLIGRAENKALVRYLDYPLVPLLTVGLGPTTRLAMVDAQPGAGNILFPDETPVALVIDHHPWREASANAAFADVRPGIGATASIMTDYLRTAGLEPPTSLATALFYGVKTDTMGLIRGTSPLDSAAYCYLQSRVDMEALARIELAQVPADYFRSFYAAVKAARVYEGVVAVYLGEMDYPDMTAEVADFFLRLEDTRWVVAMGVYAGSLILSVRTTRREGGAGQLIQKAVGSHGTAGGHGTMAGGNVPLVSASPDVLAHSMLRRLLDGIGVDAETPGRSLI